MVETLRLHRPLVDPDRILRLQKYRNPERIASVVRDAARRMAQVAEALVEPHGWVRRAPVAALGPEGTVRIAGDLEFRSQSLALLLQHATEVALFILTIGAALEQRAEALVREDHFVEGLLLDTAGWVAIDALVAQTRQQLGAEARRQECRLTGRLAPGFGDWPLDQQRILFAAFDECDLSVRLTETCVMVPRKSVSGIYGLVPLARHA
jgi:hypothetical protein